MQEVKDLIKGLVDVPTQVITGRVKEVDEANMLCVVEPDEEGADYNNVRLRAQDNEKDTGFILVPKVGSSVAISRLYNDSDTFFVILTSEVEKIVVKGEKLNLVMNVENDAGLDLNFNSGKVRLKITNTGLEILSTENVKVNSDKDIIFNNGGNGGVPVNQSIINNFNSFKTFLDAFKNWANTHTHPVAGSLANAPTLLFSETTPTAGSMANNKVKH